AAVRDRRRTERADAAARQAAAEAGEAAATAAAAHLEAQGHLSEVQATLRGFQESAEHRDLLERSRTVAAHRTTADRAADRAASARHAEEAAASVVVRVATEAVEAAARTSARLGDLAEQAAGAGVPTALPAELVARVLDVPGGTEPVRSTPDRDPEPLRRPAGATVDLGDADPAALRTAAGVVRQAAADRRNLVGTRLTEQRRLSGQETEVLRAEHRRDEALTRETDSAARRDAAVEQELAAGAGLREQWRAWVQSAETTRRLGDVDWADTVVGGWLSDPADDPADDEALDGDRLDRLDRAAAEAAAGATERLLTERADLQQQRRAADEQARELTARLADLRAERDPEPDRPGWTTSQPGIPLWRAVDFTAGASPEDQAGVEAALLGSGLLTAVLAPDGITAPASGHLLVDAAGPLAPRPLSAVLRPDPDGCAPIGQVAAVLARIGWTDRAGSCWLDRDGSFGLGALTGRHTVPHARHIGATARTRHRAEQIAVLEGELAEVQATVAA
ncbi:hypothetical protein IN07_23305, partial [Modestobacter caceresii]